MAPPAHGAPQCTPTVIAPQAGRFWLSASFASRTESSRSEGLNRERYPLKQMFTGVVPCLLYAQGMVEVIVAATTVVVMGLTALNAAHGGLVLGRPARHIAQRPAHLGLGFWLPAFGSLADLRDWLGAWGSVLGSRDPAVVAIRLGARLVVTRYLYVGLTCQTWVMAGAAIPPK